jgi:hypothetical protein
VTRELAARVNEGAAPGDVVSESQLRGRVQRVDESICTKRADNHRQSQPITSKEGSKEDNRVTGDFGNAVSIEKVSPVPEMVDADRTEGSRLLTGPTGLLHSIISSIEKYNIEQGSSKVVEKTASQWWFINWHFFPEEKQTGIYLAIVTRIGIYPVRIAQDSDCGE